MGIDEIIGLGKNKSSGIAPIGKKRSKIGLFGLGTVAIGFGVLAGASQAHLYTANAMLLRSVERRVAAYTPRKNARPDLQFEPEVVHLSSAEKTVRPNLQFEPMVVERSTDDYDSETGGRFVLDSPNPEKQKVFRLIKRAIPNLSEEGLMPNHNLLPVYMAIVHSESEFAAHSNKRNPYADSDKSICWTISKAGAVGHMQNMPSPIPKHEPVLTRADLGLHNHASQRKYGIALRNHCEETPLDELVEQDVRFDPYKDVYYGLRTFNMSFMKFTPGEHTYYSYRRGRRVMGEELVEGKQPIGNVLATHTLNIEGRRDALIFALASYNMGAYGLMGIVVKKEVTDGENLLEVLPKSVASYIRNVLSGARRYKTVIRNVDVAGNS